MRFEAAVSVYNAEPARDYLKLCGTTDGGTLNITSKISEAGLM